MGVSVCSTVLPGFQRGRPSFAPGGRANVSSVRARGIVEGEPERGSDGGREDSGISSTGSKQVQAHERPS